MAYFNIKQGKLPKTHPFYKTDSETLVNPLCKVRNTKIGDEYRTNYYDNIGNTYIKNPIQDFLPDASAEDKKFFQQDESGLLYAGYGLGLEKSLDEYSIDTPGSSSFVVRKNSNGYGYDLVDVNAINIYGPNADATLSNIAPIVFFEIVGGGGGGALDSYFDTSNATPPEASYGGGGGGGGGAVRGLLDLSKFDSLKTEINFSVGAGGKGGTYENAKKINKDGDDGEAGESSAITIIDETYYYHRISALGGKGGKCGYDENNQNGGNGGGIFTNTDSDNNYFYILSTSDGGNGGSGACNMIATKGDGTSIDSYILAGNVVINSASTENTPVKDANGTDLYDNGLTVGVGGSGGCSAIGQGGGSGVSAGYYGAKTTTAKINGILVTETDAGNGRYPGGGGGGGCHTPWCYVANNEIYYDYTKGGDGADGRILLKYATMCTIDEEVATTTVAINGTWTFNDTLIVPKDGILEIDLPTNKFNKLTYIGTDDLLYYNDTTEAYNFCTQADKFGWQEGVSKTFTIEGTKEISVSFYSWLSKNAKKISDENILTTVPPESKTKIYTLKGNWLFKETVSTNYSAFDYVYEDYNNRYTFEYHIPFTSNGTEYSSIQLVMNAGINYGHRMNNSFTTVFTDDASAWNQLAYRSITLTAEREVTKEFWYWITENATQGGSDSGGNESGNNPGPGVTPESGIK